MLANVYEYLWHVIYHTLSFEIKADSTFLHYEDLNMEITIEERSVIDKWHKVMVVYTCVGFDRIHVSRLNAIWTVDVIAHESVSTLAVFLNL